MSIETEARKRLGLTDCEPIPTYYPRNNVIAAFSKVLNDSMPQDGTTPEARIIARSTVALVAELSSRVLNLDHDEKHAFFAFIGLEH